MAKIFPLESKGFNPFGTLIGLNFTQCDSGMSVCTLEVEEKLLNPNRVVHGGVLYSMADTGMGAALYSYLNEDELGATIEIKINYLRALSEGRVNCETKVIYKGNRIAVLESVITKGGDLIAKASGTFAIFKGSVE